MDKLFFVDKAGIEYRYSDLVAGLQSCTQVPPFCRNSGTYEIFSTLLSGIIHSVDMVLLDSDFSDSELRALGVEPTDLEQRVTVNPKVISNIGDVYDAIAGASSWKLTLYTSGTTGLPKSVTHGLENLTRLVRKSPKHNDDVWAFAYNPTHIAGIQVFLQALLNNNSLVDVFGVSRDIVTKRIGQYRVTNISATPTFYRMLLPIDHEYPSVKRITFGGERFDASLADDMKRMFPNAKPRNIYASTEAGSVLESTSDRFKITDPERCRIEDGRLFIHNSLLGESNTEDGWYDTGDLVEPLDLEQSEFRFLSRASEIINVGGYKANPLEIEEVLCSHPFVSKARVWGKANAIVGNILMADIVLTGDCEEKDIRLYLKEKLQGFKIPRVITFVADIDTTRSGKIKRG